MELFDKLGEDRILIFEVLTTTSWVRSGLKPCMARYHTFKSRQICILDEFRAYTLVLKFKPWIIRFLIILILGRRSIAKGFTNGF